MKPQHIYLNFLGFKTQEPVITLVLHPGDAVNWYTIEETYYDALFRGVLPLPLYDVRGWLIQNHHMHINNRLPYARPFLSFDFFYSHDSDSGPLHLSIAPWKMK